MRLLLTAVGIALATATMARAGGPEDGQAGLAALEQGHYQKAITLFSRALKSRQLSVELQEFALLSRGKAHAALHNKKLANVDYQHALTLNPNDADAQQALAALNASQATGAKPVAVAARNPWGALAALADHVWLETGGSTGHWYSYAWEQPGTILAFKGMDQAGNAYAGHYQLDPATGRITGLTVAKGTSVQSEITGVSDAGYVEEGAVQGVPIRTTATQDRSGLWSQTTLAFQDNAWKQLSAVKLVQTSPDVIVALNWKQSPQESGFMKFLKGLGSAAAEGMKAGLTDGLHEGVQARTAHGIAPKQLPNPQQ